MDSLLISIVGVCAGFCSMISFIPQIGKIISERSAQGVSLKMFSVTVSAFVLWTTYAPRHFKKAPPGWQGDAAKAYCSGPSTF